MAVSVVTPPTEYPVTLAEARAHCRVDGSDDDATLNALIAAATDHIEKMIGRSVMEQTLMLSLDGFADELVLPRGPVQDVTTVKYFDVDGAEQTLDAAVYQVDDLSDPPRVLLADGQSWPETALRANAVNITYTAGYDETPPSIKHACLLLIGFWFDNRSTVNIGNITSDLPHAVAALLSNYRAYSF